MRITVHNDAGDVTKHWNDDGMGVADDMADAVSSAIRAAFASGLSMGESFDISVVF